MVIIDIVVHAPDDGSHDSAFDNEITRADPNPDKSELKIED
jgi:hypothetical protein